MVNAMDAMPQGGTLRVAVAQDETIAKIEVSDTGCGIPENLRDKILDPYFTTKNSGTGLGLAICDKIIRQHLGTLDFRSSPQGTTFQITLPNVNPA
jgi:two-component system nitrogen regulation sensor histidine kinase GlnL